VSFATSAGRERGSEMPYRLNTRGNLEWVSPHSSERTCRRCKRRRAWRGRSCLCGVCVCRRERIRRRDDERARLRREKAEQRAARRCRRCGGPYFTKGLCRACYSRVYRAQNGARLNQQQRERVRRRYQTDPTFRQQQIAKVRQYLQTPQGRAWKRQYDREWRARRRATAA
jgi:hypothetical protein